MGKFITPLRVEQVQEAEGENAIWRLTDPFIYESIKLGLVIVDRNELTDFASVPRIPIAYWLAGGKGNAPAVLHDKTYDPDHETGRGVKVTRLQADNLLFEAYIDSSPVQGYSIKSIFERFAVYASAGLIWTGVRLFGWRYWA